jgi:hypothetical protein
LDPELESSADRAKQADAGSSMPPRLALLNAAIECTAADRPSKYGHPVEQAECAGQLKRVMFYFMKRSERTISAAEQESLEMVATKLSRICCGSQVVPDNYTDGAAYLAIAGEAASLTTKD